MTLERAEIYLARLRRIFEPPSRMDVDQWAESHREVSKIANAKGGRWHSRPMQREIQQELTNPDVRSVVIVSASQTGGKTEIILNFTGRQIHQNPGPMMIVQPTNEMAERFSKKRLEPMLRETQALRDLCAERKSRNASNTIRQKQFPGGTLNVAGANTPNELCADPIRDVCIDEVDRCEQAAGKEGDIITLAEQRQESFGEDAFSLYTSTPSGEEPNPLGQEQPLGVSKILLLFKESDQRYWFCPCQKCGHRQVLKWEQIWWPEHAPEEARYICEAAACKHHHTDAERIAMVEAGEWRATASFSGRRGYFLDGICSLSKAQRGAKNKLHQMAREYLRAKARGTEALRAWNNTFLCRCFRETSTENVLPAPLMARRETFGEQLPEGVLILTAGVDIHPDRIEIQVIGWGEHEEAWALDYATLEGNPMRVIPGLDVWSKLDQLLNRRYPHPLGVELGIERACIDTGHATDEAYAFCRARSLRSIFAVKGYEGIGCPAIALPRKSVVRPVRLRLVSSNTTKRTIYSRLKILTPGAGFIHFRDDRSPQFEEKYFKQLTAEEVITVRRNGKYVEIFNANGRRNESLDTFCYALAALLERPTNFTRIRARLHAQAKGEPPAQRAVPQPRRPSWVMGGFGPWKL